MLGLIEDGRSTHVVFQQEENGQDFSAPFIIDQQKQVVKLWEPYPVPDGRFWIFGFIHHPRTHDICFDDGDHYFLTNFNRLKHVQKLPVPSLHGLWRPESECLSFSDDGKLVLLPFYRLNSRYALFPTCKRVLILLDITTGRVLSELEVNLRYFHTFAISPSNKYIAITLGRKIEIYQIHPEQAQQNRK